MNIVSAAASLGALTLANRAHIPAGGNLEEHRDALARASHVVIDEPLTSDDLSNSITMYPNATTLTVAAKGNCRLEHYSRCYELQTLAIRVFSRGGVYPLLSDVQIHHLQSLTITDATIPGGFFSSIRGLPLREVVVDYCDLLVPGEVARLQDMRSLKVIRLKSAGIGEGVIRDDFHKGVAELQSALPSATVVVKAPNVERRDYAGLLTPEKSSRYCFSLAALSERGWTIAELQRLLDVEGSCEDDNWPSFDGTKVLSRNRLEGFTDASPIVCPDRRVRIAIQEPCHNSEISNFWKNVPTHNVTVIVMVMRPLPYLPTKYIPMAGREMVVNGKKLKCTAMSCDDVNMITERTLEIGARKVQHIQIDWEDGCGIDPEKLVALLDRIAVLEKENPGQTVVQCFGGYGRTGVTFAALITKWFIENTKNLESLSLDVEVPVRGLRQQRKKMISTGDQVDTLLRFTDLIYQRELKKQDEQDKK